MHKFEKANFNIDHYDETENYGKFVIEPLERGFGITLGNKKSFTFFFTWFCCLCNQSSRSNPWIFRNWWCRWRCHSNDFKY